MLRPAGTDAAPKDDEQALVCLSYRDMFDASRGRQ